MREVAARARVSAKTVSRVVNNDPHVLPETRTRVTEALRELRYVPNAMARTFRAGGAPVLGVAVPDIADPFFALVAKAVEDVAAAHDMSVVVSSLGCDPEREQGVLESLLRRPLSGLVVAPTSPDQGHLARWTPRLPVVFVDRPPRGLEADTITEDDHEGARMATAHLVAHGHREIAFVGDSPQVPTTAARLAGHRAALADAGLLARDELVAFRDTDSGAPGRVVQRLARSSPPPTALFSADARTTMALVPELAGSTWAVVGFGDFPMADMLSPALTVVDQDPAALGRLAAERVLERLGAPEGAPPRRTVLSVRLVERQSCRAEAHAAGLFPFSAPELDTSASRVEPAAARPHRGASAGPRPRSPRHRTQEGSRP
jgi:LacI family transcriptional regulator